MGNVAAALGVGLASSVSAEAKASPRRPGEMIFTRLPGLLYLPSHVMERNRLVEKHAARLGLPDVSVRWQNVSTGLTQRAALMAGQADVVVSGLVPLMRLWDSTDGGVKAIIASGVMPLSLVSADPRVRSLRDIVVDDRIAVPVLRYSTQAVLLQMAACQLYGLDAWRHFEKKLR